jgi:hypothetical protein
MQVPRKLIPTLGLAGCALPHRGPRRFIISGACAAPQFLGHSWAMCGIGEVLSQVENLLLLMIIEMLLLLDCHIMLYDVFLLKMDNFDF